MWMDEKIGRRINVTRVEQALTRSPTTIATACPYCAVMLQDGVNALGQADNVKIRDIAELVGESLAADDHGAIANRPVVARAPVVAFRTDGQ